jgi:hypothetical protein
MRKKAPRTFRGAAGLALLAAVVAVMLTSGSKTAIGSTTSIASGGASPSDLHCCVL